MSPERGPERLVADAIASSIRRARELALGEAVAWGLAVAAVSPVAGVLLAAAIGAWRWRTTSRASIVRALEHAQPGFGNLLVTADELARETLTAKPPVRARVFADAAGRVQHARSARRVSDRSVDQDRVTGSPFVWTTVETAHLWRNRATREGGAGRVADGAIWRYRSGLAPAGERRDRAARVHRPPGNEGRRSGAAAGDRRQLARSVDRCDGSARQRRT